MLNFILFPDYTGITICYDPHIKQSSSWPSFDWAIKAFISSADIGSTSIAVCCSNFLAVFTACCFCWATIVSSTSTISATGLAFFLDYRRILFTPVHQETAWSKLGEP